MLVQLACLKCLLKRQRNNQGQVLVLTLLWSKNQVRHLFSHLFTILHSCSSTCIHFNSHWLNSSACFCILCTIFHILHTVHGFLMNSVLWWIHSTYNTGQKTCTAGIVALTGHLHHVVLVGARTFVRLLSGRVGQHHLHPHAVDDAAVQRRHGVVGTLRQTQDNVTGSEARITDTHLQFPPIAINGRLTCLSAYFMYPTFLPGTKWTSMREPKRLQRERESRGNIYWTSVDAACREHH